MISKIIVVIAEKSVEWKAMERVQDGLCKRQAMKLSRDTLSQLVEQLQAAVQPGSEPKSPVSLEYLFSAC
jgi:hypothetical protein